MPRAMQLLDALDHDPRRAGARDPRPHLVEAIGDVGDFGLAGGVGDDGRALRKRCRHQGYMGAAHRHLGEIDPRTAQAARRLRDHIAAVDGELSAEFFERHDQEIDRPRADGAAARQRDFCLVHPRQQGRDHPEAGAHPRHQVVRRRGVDDVGCRNMQGLALILAVAGPLACGHDVDAVVAEDALQLRDVGQPRHIVEDQRFLREQGCDHQGKRGIFRARDGNGAVELAAADDTNAVHATPLAMRNFMEPAPPRQKP